MKHVYLFFCLFLLSGVVCAEEFQLTCKVDAQDLGKYWNIYIVDTETSEVIRTSLSGRLLGVVETIDDNYLFKFPAVANKYVAAWTRVHRYSGEMESEWGEPPFFGDFNSSNNFASGKCEAGEVNLLF